MEATGPPKGVLARASAGNWTLSAVPAIAAMAEPNANTRPARTGGRASKPTRNPAVTVAGTHDKNCEYRAAEPRATHWLIPIIDATGATNTSATPAIASPTRRAVPRLRRAGNPRAKPTTNPKIGRASGR